MFWVTNGQTGLPPPRIIFQNFQWFYFNYNSCAVNAMTGTEKFINQASDGQGSVIPHLFVQDFAAMGSSSCTISCTFG